MTSQIKIKMFMDITVKSKTNNNTISKKIKVTLNIQKKWLDITLDQLKNTYQTPIITKWRIRTTKVSSQSENHELLISITFITVTYIFVINALRFQYLVSLREHATSLKQRSIKVYKLILASFKVRAFHRYQCIEHINLKYLT